MHKCVRCGKTAKSLEEINAGCSCGAKVFVFTRLAEDSEPIEKNGHDVFPKHSDTYHARTTFSSEDVENVKVVSEGVFLLDVNMLSKNPLVLKDEEGVYYVKLPYDNDGKGQISPIQKGNGSVAPNKNAKTAESEK